MENKPLVSIVIPAYNVEKYIEKCINSCLEQTYDKIEIIVVDDSSKDKTYEIIDKISKKDSRIKPYKQKNSGVSVARNLGIEKSNGSWIMFLDGDDWLENNAVAIFTDFIISSNKQYDIVVSDFYYGDEVEKKYSSFLDKENSFFDTTNNIELVKNCMLKTKIANQKCKTNIGVPWGKIYNLNFLKENNIMFKPGLKRMQDMVFNLYAFNSSKNVFIINKPTYNYRYVSTSATHKYSPDFEQISNNIMESIEEFMEASNTKEELEDLINIKSLNLYKECIKLAYCNSNKKENILKINKELIKLRNNNKYYSKLPIKKINKKFTNYKTRLLNFFIKIKCDFILYLIQK